MMTDSVLLIDDDPLFVRIVSQTLGAGGYDVDAADNTLAAEALLSQRDFAAIILSLDVRDRDPETFLQALASDDRQPIVILVGTHLDIQEMVRLYDHASVYSHRRKPLEDVGDLVRDLGRAIQYRMVRRQNSYLLTQLRDSRDDLRDMSEFMIQVEKVATLGWLAQGLVSDMEATLDEAPSLSEPGSGRVMRTGGLTDLQKTFERMRALVHDARSVMRPSSGETRPVDIARLLSSSIRLHRSSLRARNIESETGPIDDSVAVNGDGPQLRLVIAALLQNAAQAMPAGGRLTVSLVQHGANVHLAVRDTGPGMANDVLSRAFDPFFTTRKMGEGTGLGLTVAREIVHRHGGEIVLASVEGEGTTAVVTLPVVTAESMAPAVQSAEESIPAAA